MKSLHVNSCEALPSNLTPRILLLLWHRGGGNADTVVPQLNTEGISVRTPGSIISKPGFSLQQDHVVAISRVARGQGQTALCHSRAAGTKDTLTPERCAPDSDLSALKATSCPTGLLQEAPGLGWAALKLRPALRQKQDWHLLHLE